MWDTLTRVSCAYIYFGAVLAGECLIKLRHYRKPQHAARQWNRPRCRAILLTRGPWWWFGFHSCLYTRCFATGGTIQGVAYGMMLFSRWLQWVAYTPSLWSGSIRLVSSSHAKLCLWNRWDDYEWYCYFVVVQYWETRGYFWKRSVSLSFARCLGSLSFCLCLVAVFCLFCLLVSVDTLLSFSPILQ